MTAQVDLHGGRSQGQVQIATETPGPVVVVQVSSSAREGTADESGGSAGDMFSN